LATRRSVLAGATAAGAFGLSGFSRTRRCELEEIPGTKLEVISRQGAARRQPAKEHQGIHRPDGIQVESEQIPEQQQRQKAVIELASGKPSFDVIHLSYHVQKAPVREGRWLADITPFMKDPSLTAPDLVESDFLGRGSHLRQERQGADALAAVVGRLLHPYYNKEIFEKKGVSVPKNAR